MEYSYFSCDATYPFLPHSQAYSTQPFPDEYDTAGQDMLLGFPCHDASAQPLDLYGNTSMQNASMQRFLKDNQRAPLFNPIPQPQVPSLTQLVNAIPPTASHGRQGSPFSSNEPSSCSGGQSPHADTELYTDNTPSTPSDTMLFAPYAAARQGPYEPEGQLPLFEVGEVLGEPDQFMTAGDCNIIEGPTKTRWEDSGQAIDFDTPQHSFTCGSQTEDCTDAAGAATQDSVGPAYRRLASPEDTSTVTKDEILIPEHFASAEKTTGAYPSPSTGASEDDLEELDVAASQSEDDEDDDDYHPDRKHAGSAAPRSNKLKRAAAKRPLDMPALKKARTASSAQPLKILPPPSARTQGSYLCPECSHSFKDECTLQGHVKKQHTRPFICVFGFAGCQSTFASKNEWKRHVMSQHLLLHFWLCDIDMCAHNKNDPTAPHSHSGKRNKGRRAKNVTAGELQGPPLPDGAIFNRKDLYTQHLRRMHRPAQINKTGSAKLSKKATASSPASSTCANPADWDDNIKTLQNNALRERCQLPEYMACPAPHCTHTFNGVDAWDQRMEHVARHLDKAATGAEEPVVFGGPSDPSLMAWVARPDVAVARQVKSTGEWVLNNPLRPASDGRAAGRKKSAAAATSPVVAAASPAVAFVASEILVEDEDEDAEGEEE
ncbi:hypothetical protein DHEL01_v201055 [Diaporthe helianthi]|uniref:C2H2-type domain-containing protein n=1 Tax=Diaporthe helianthi TaxID=158607 RepID=A0A2P5IDG8_DIAHE|nr:hypothetical protein DHEL01_v201055 [Diaporthe helianthi]